MRTLLCRLFRLWPKEKLRPYGADAVDAGERFWQQIFTDAICNSLTDDEYTAAASEGLITAMVDNAALVAELALSKKEARWPK